MGLEFEVWPADLVNRYVLTARALCGTSATISPDLMAHLATLVSAVDRPTWSSEEVQGFARHILAQAALSVASTDVRAEPRATVAVSHEAQDEALRASNRQARIDSMLAKDSRREAAPREPSTALAGVRESMRLTGHESWVTALACDRKGQWLASGGVDGTIRLWSLSTGKALDAVSGHAGWVNALAVSRVESDGTWIASGGADRQIHIWSVMGDRISRPLSRRDFGRPISGHSRGITSLTFGASRDQMMSGSADETIGFTRIDASITQRMLKQHSGTVSALCYLAQLNWVASAGDDGRLLIWDVADCKSVGALDGHVGAIQALAVDPDGRWLASGSRDGMIRIWDFWTGAALSEMCVKGSTNGQVNALTAVGDARLASGGEDGSIRVWDPSSGACLHTIKAHTRAIRALAAPRDGSWLATGSEDGSIKVWRGLAT